MRDKPRIGKYEGAWIVIRPLFGFRPVPEVIPFDSWPAAFNSLCLPGSTGTRVERAYHPTDGVTPTPGWTPLG